MTLIIKKRYATHVGYTSVLLANSGQLASDNSSITFVIWTVAGKPCQCRVHVR